MLIRLYVYIGWLICRWNFALKFQAIAEKTAKNLRGLLFCCTLYVGWHLSLTSDVLLDSTKNIFSAEIIIRSIRESIHLRRTVMCGYKCWQLLLWYDCSSVMDKYEPLSLDETVKSALPLSTVMVETLDLQNVSDEVQQIDQAWQMLCQLCTPVLLSCRCNWCKLSAY